MTARRLAQGLSIAIVVGIGIATLIWAITDLHFNDLRSYQAAALRIREGEQLYGGDVTPFNKYYYAPWFAFAFVPLSYLPWELMMVGWTSFTVASSVVVVWPLARHGSLAGKLAAAILGPILVALSMSGNVHAPMLALLVLLLPTRWGPVAIGIAASLKATPIILVMAYLGRREWRHAALALLVAAALWAPILLFKLAPVTFDPGGAATPTEAWIGLGALGVAAAFVVSRRWPRHRWLASGVAVYLATPRLYVYDITILCTALVERPATHDRRAVGMGPSGRGRA